MSLPLNYFLNELLFSPASELENAQSATLVVLTVADQCDSVDEQFIEVLRDCRAWVLDFDLDFFSTANPFKSMFSEVSQYTLAACKIDCTDDHKSPHHFCSGKVLDLLALFSV